jgi:yeast amino acid transporter
MFTVVPNTTSNPAEPSCSIGGVIGTGLFLGTAGSLANGGPVGLLLGYVVVGTICFSV